MATGTLRFPPKRAPPSAHPLIFLCERCVNTPTHTSEPYRLKGFQLRRDPRGGGFAVAPPPANPIASRVQGLCELFWVV